MKNILKVIRRAIQKINLKMYKISYLPYFCEIRACFKIIKTKNDQITLIVITNTVTLFVYFFFTDVCHTLISNGL